MLQIEKIFFFIIFLNVLCCGCGSDINVTNLAQTSSSKKTNSPSEVVGYISSPTYNGAKENADGYLTVLNEQSSSYNNLYPNEQFYKAYWKFDEVGANESTANTLVDSSGQGHTATLTTGDTTTIKTTTGKIGNALYFDSDDIATGSNSGGVLDRLSNMDYTIMYWFKRSGGSFNRSQPLRLMFGATIDNQYGLELKSDTTMNFWEDTATNVGEVTNMNHPLDSWAHAAVTVENGSTLKIYYNGEESASSTSDNTPHTVTGFRLAEACNCTVDEVIFLGRTLSSTELLNIYHRQRPTYAGIYTSPIKDFLTPQTYSTLSPIPQAPYGKPLINAPETNYSAGEDLSTGLISFFHLDGSKAVLTDGTTITDDVDGTYSGTTAGTNSIRRGDGILNESLMFDGNDDEVNFGNQPDFYLQYPMSISAWIRVKELPSVLGQNQAIMNVDLHSSSRMWELRLDRITDKLEFTVYPNGSSTGQIQNYSNWTLSEAELNQWIHVSVTVSSTGDITFYINGEASGTATIGNLNIPAVSPNFTIGNRETSNYQFFGNIDEVGVWAKELSASEVQSLYLRAAARILYQVRSCDDAACDGENFIGPDGTSNTYYSELTNSTGDLPTFNLVGVNDNRYFQYRAIFESEHPTTSKPILRSAKVNNEDF